jgi:hypothetical protein
MAMATPTVTVRESEDLTLTIDLLPANLGPAKIGISYRRVVDGNEVETPKGPISPGQSVIIHAAELSTGSEQTLVVSASYPGAIGKTKKFEFKFTQPEFDPIVDETGTNKVSISRDGDEPTCRINLEPVN